MYPTKRMIIVIIMLLTGISAGLWAQDLEVRFVDEPIPGVPLKKGNVGKIEPDVSIDQQSMKPGTGARLEITEDALIRLTDMKRGETASEKGIETRNETSSSGSPNLIADYTPSGWDYPLVPSSVSGTHSVGPNLEGGTTTYIDFAFVNRNAPIPSSTRFYIYLYSDGQYIAGFYFDGLGANHYGYFADYEHIFDSGDHVLRMKVDATDVVEESNEDDNTYQRKFTWGGEPPLPNLIADYTPTGWDYPIVPSSVPGTHTAGPNLEGGTTTYIDFALVNRDAPIPSSTRFYVYLYSNNNHLAGWYFDGLGQNTYGYVEDYEYIFSSGDHTLKTTVDATNTVEESNEDDNTYQRKFTWAGEPPLPNLIADYTHTRARWESPIVASSVPGNHTIGPNLQEGATTYIDFAFINRGSAIPVETEFYVYLFNDDMPIIGFSWDGMPENQYGYISDFEYVFMAGEHVLKTWVDPTNVVTESDETDNVYEQSFTWAAGEPDIDVQPVTLDIYEGADTPRPVINERDELQSSQQEYHSEGSIIPDEVKEYWKTHTPDLEYDASTFPASIDWSFNDSPVKSQGSCGACWAFSAVALVENLSGISDLSEQVIVSCAKENGCSGGSLGDAFQYIQDEGVPDENCYPYLEANGDCDDKCEEPSIIVKVNKFDRYGRWSETTPSTVNDLKSLLQSGPVAVHMKIPPDNSFDQYRGGIYNYNGGPFFKELGHGILAVGYDDNQQCFKAKNSWGTDWGENGYFRISYDDVTDYVGFGAFAATASGTIIIGGEGNITIANTGTGMLEITEIVSDRDWLTTYQPVPMAVYLAAGDSQTFHCEIDWESVPGEADQATLTIHSNDMDEPATYVTVTAYKNYNPPPPPNAPDVPTLFSPINNSTDIMTTIKLTWNPAARASTYSLEVDDDQNFGSPFLSQSGITDNWRFVSGLEVSTLYYWRVNASNGAGTSAWSDVWHFTTESDTFPDEPVLLFPPNNSVNQPTTLTFRWNPAGGASSYSLLVDDNENFLSPEYERSGLTSTSHEVSGLATATTYYWRVNAANENGSLAWSDAWRFTTLSSDGIVIASLGCDEVVAGGQITIPLNMNMSGMNSPNEKLGNFTGYLKWDPTILAYHSNSGISGGFTGNVAASSDSIHFDGSSSAGVAGEATILEITYDAIAAGKSLLDLEYLELAASSTSTDLMPYLIVYDDTVEVTPQMFTLDVIVLPENAGSVTRNPEKEQYPGNETVQLTATPASEDYEFDHWEGHMTGDANPCNLLMNGDKSVTAHFRLATTVDSDAEMPTSFALHQNYPNPFNMETTISYSLPEASGIKLVIYNTHGQIVDIIDAGQKSAGTHQISWTGRDANGTIVPSGIYLLKLYSSNPKTIATRKLVLLK